MLSGGGTYVFFSLLIAENTHVIANLHAFVRPDIYVCRIAASQHLMKVERGHHRSHGLAADGRKMIEFAGVLVRRNWALLERPQDISALHVIARKHNLCDRNLGMHANDANMADIPVKRTHFLR